MKKVYLQYWEESERGWGIRPDGCSLHLTEEDRNKYITSIYEQRKNDKEVPYEYDRPVGELIEVMINDNLFELIKESYRLLSFELNNLIKLEEIVIL
jgi:hypothetical protein